MGKNVGKFVALVLRHKPEAAGLTLDPEGWCPVDDLVRALNDRYGDYSRDDLNALVSADNKGRYIIDGDRIRANQGHSVEVDLGLVQTAPPKYLYHGTKAKNLESIFKQGLVRGERRHVHLSPDLETAKVVAGRRSGESTILRVAAARMNDYAFFVSQNGVWLIDTVPPEYIEVLDA